MFFSRPGEYPPCGLFNIKHLILAISTFLVIFILLKTIKINNKSQIKNIIRKTIIRILILEVIKTIFTISIGEGNTPNKILPLYYCSLLLYAGILSSFCKGKLQKIGDTFLATGAIVGGTVFLIAPTTSLPEYPMLHFISIHSFFFHGTMIFLGLLINKHRYIELKLSDIKYYALLIFIICMLALGVNIKFGSNLMFISQDFPGMPLSDVYHATGKWFTPLMIVVQMTLPYLIVYSINCICNKVKRLKKI